MRFSSARSLRGGVSALLPTVFTHGAVWIGLLLALLLLAPPSRAQPTQPAQLSSSARLSLITGMPGDQLHTEFGHSAIRVYDPQQGIDWLYNYGTFNFGDPYFVPKFTYGRLRYFLSISAYRGTVDLYHRQGRPVIEQRLNLTAEHRQKLWQFLRHNARPAHRYYRYDFLFDNCSTRIRDAFKNALGEDVDFSGAPDPDLTFREMLDLYVADRPLLDFGFDLGLGTPTDADVSAQEAMFLPEYLMEAFDEATIRIDGRRQPLVAETDTVRRVEGYDAREGAFDWPTALTWLLFAAGAAWTAGQWWTGRSPGRWGDATLLAVTGLAGLVICFLWFIAEHTVTNYNWNLLWAWPTHVVAAALLVRSGDSVSPRLRTYLAASAGVAGLLAAGWALVPQHLHSAALPIALLLAVRTGWRAQDGAHRMAGDGGHATRDPSLMHS